MQDVRLVAIYKWMPAIAGMVFEVRVCSGCGLVEWFVPERYLAEVKERLSRA